MDALLRAVTLPLSHRRIRSIIPKLTDATSPESRAFRPKVTGTLLHAHLVARACAGAPSWIHFEDTAFYHSIWTT
jgi:hypothetical protein